MVERIKSVLEPFYTDRCTVFEKVAVRRDGRTVFEESVKYEHIPCRASAKAYLFGESAAGWRDNMLKVNKRIKLFLPCEYVIREGSRIEVEIQGKRLVFAKSGVMSFYSSHNEVMVEILKNYA